MHTLNTIAGTYSRQNLPGQGNLVAHFTKGMATSAAALKGVPLSQMQQQHGVLLVCLSGSTESTWHPLHPLLHWVLLCCSLLLVKHVGQWSLLVLVTLMVLVIQSKDRGDSLSINLHYFTESDIYNYVKRS